MTATFQVIVEPEDGVFVTYVPTLNFASTYGATREEALDRTREMIAGYIEAADKQGITIDVPPVDQRAELVDLAINVQRARRNRFAGVNRNDNEPAPIAPQEVMRSADVRVGEPAAE